MSRISDLFEIRDDHHALHDTARVFGVLLILAGLVGLGAVAGACITDKKWMRETHRRGFSEFDQESREWRWKGDQK